MAFVHRVRVRYAEVDAQGVVFNAHWLTYFDEAITRFFEELGYPPKHAFSHEGHFDLMLRRSDLQFEGPAGFDDVVEVAVEPTRLGGASFDVRFTATVDGRAAVTALTTYVVVVPGEPRSQPIPDDLRDRLDARLAGGRATS